MAQCSEHTSIAERVVKNETNITVLIEQSTTTFKKLDALSESLKEVALSSRTGKWSRNTIILIMFLSNTIVGLFMYILSVV